ncbi:SDR family oxidoreductase [Gordonia sinesedis]
MSTQRKLSGRRVVITGGARGIGLATAREFAKRGATVVIGDLTAAAVAAGVAAIGSSAEGYVLDVTDHESFSDFYAKASAAGPVDVLINNAGIMPIGHFEQQQPEIQRRAVEVNVMGCISGLQLAVTDMRTRGRGHIINVASAAGKSPVPGGLVYCGTKAAVVMMTETARMEYAGSGIEFTCVMPNFTNTELIAGTTSTRFIPMASPEQVATAIADAVARPKADVIVPAVMTPALKAQPFLPRRLRDRFAKLIGADKAFLTFDPNARSTYDARISAE